MTQKENHRSGGKNPLSAMPTGLADVDAATITCFVETCHDIARRGLMRCSSGNFSLRLGADLLLVTATRSWLERITPQDIALCRITDGQRIGGAKPTVELSFHAGIMRARPDINVVLHFQTPCATTMACRRGHETINYNVIPEIPFYIGPVAAIPYLPPGSAELAAAVIDAMRNHDLGVMANHGQVTVARDADHAIQNALFFELACEIILRNGPQLAPLAADAAHELHAARATPTQVSHCT